jgi:hypothetical protein
MARSSPKICHWLSTRLFASQALGNNDYAERAIKLVRAFFLDEETKMCPEVLCQSVLSRRRSGMRGQDIHHLRA